MPLLVSRCRGTVEAGCDEVGRGALAGPVVAAAVIWNPEFDGDGDGDSSMWLKIRDSKKLSSSTRAALADFIRDVAIDYCVSFIEPGVIDEVNILQASMRAMHQALDGLSVMVDSILVDGDRFRPYMPCTSSTFVPHECIVGGDDKYVSIAAASILAKVARDEYMLHLADSEDSTADPYDWRNNKGYGTRRHFEALRTHGPSVHHRRTFLRNSSSLGAGTPSRSSRTDIVGID